MASEATSLACPLLGTLRMMSFARCTWITLLAGLAACGGTAKGPSAPVAVAPRLEPAVVGQTWYRAQSTCGQGPYEIEVPATGARWGEDFELRLRTPRRVAIQAVILVDDAEVVRAGGVFDGSGTAAGKAENTRCVADARERLVLGRPGGGGGGTGTPGTPGTRVRIETPPAPTGTATLELDTSLVTTSTSVLTFTMRDPPRPGARIKLRFWSIEPNDLLDVLFGVARIEWRPNVAERDYEAHLSRIAAEEEARRLRMIEDERLREEQWRRDAQRRLDQTNRRATVAVTVHVETAAELAARKNREAEELAAYRAEQAERQRRALEAESKRREADRRAAIEAALEIERRARRTAFCASHAEDRGCWGAGGLRVHLELEQRQRERAEYCAAAKEDARCWSDEDWSRRRTAWNTRVTVALQPPKQPDGPPPAPLAEVTPPRLSVHATWRPGYWHWIDGTWVWLAGQWRVPDEDIVAEQTTTAPAAPPPPQSETATIAPVRTAVWISGFWQWNGSSWVWISGSWQLRPTAQVTWRAPEWRPRGNVHVLIPGGWIRIGGR